MSETLVQGPLDVARNLQAEALRFDAFAQAHLERSPHDLVPLAEKLHRLDYSHPWMGQEVSLYGIPLTVSIDNELAVPYCLPPGLQRSTIKGVYNGMTIRHLYDAETDEQKYKVVYMLRTHITGPTLDAFGDIHATEHYSYMCIQGSEGSPVFPLDAHSLRDLSDDPVVDEIDEVMFDEESDPLLQVTMLGERVNEALAEEEFESMNLNHQRVSYLNSLGLHDHVQLVANDLMIGDQSALPAGAMFSSMESAIAIEPYFFTIAPGYDRLTGHDKPLLGGPPELYAQVSTEDGQVVLAPLKSVLGVETINS